MSKYQELEIKVLNVLEEEVISRLNKIGASFVRSRVQKIYTYDCYDPVLMYRLAICDYKLTGLKNSLEKIINIISYVNPVFTKEDEEVFRRKFDGLLIDEYILHNMDCVSLEKLEDPEVIGVIEETKNRFFKWIRLRQDGDEVEITLKYIYNTNPEYGIDEVKEVEIKVDDFETANKLIEEMGYYRRKLVEKKRVSYTYDGMMIEIDTWPMLDPYIEIEGDDVDKIYGLALELGYSKEEVRVMNTEDVYLESGIDLTAYEVMTFDYQKLSD